VSCRESIKASVKVTLTDSDGKVLKVIEGESPDPFNIDFLNIIIANMFGPDYYPSSYIDVADPFGNFYTFGLMTPSPPSDLGYLIPGFCLINCPNAGSTPPNGPGIWLFSDLPPAGGIPNYGTPWRLFEIARVPSQSFITGLSYSSIAISGGVSTPSSSGDVVYEYFYITQNITNTLSSPVNIYTIMLVGAVYGTLSASPVYMPITFYVFSPPIVLSPGVTMTVTVTLSLPFATALPPT
jgi:hypothetical protein